jgi:hypothetical protein
MSESGRLQSVFWSPAAAADPQLVSLSLFADREKKYKTAHSKTKQNPPQEPNA